MTAAAVWLHRRQLEKLAYCTLTLTLLLSTSVQCQSKTQSKKRNQTISVDAIVPANYETKGEDQYVCFRVDLPPRGLKIIGVDPLSTQDVVHHMLLYGCGSTGPPNEPYNCHMSSPCNGGFERVLYGWGKNAPPMNLPDGVGYSVGAGSAIQSLVLQVHYLQERPKGDQSGVRLHMGSRPTPFAAGMINYASYFTIPPGKAEHPIENQCCYSGFEVLKGFAFRVHTHAMGRSVNLERVSQVKGNTTTEELCEKDPQLPQGFTPLKTDIQIRPGDTLKATCMFDSSKATRPVNAGATHNDEMCNLYLMLYSQLPYFMACYGSPQVEKHGMGGIPREGRIENDPHEDWQPPPAIGSTLPPVAKKSSMAIGQVSAVAKGLDDDIWIFHRGTKIWDAQTFMPNGSSDNIADPKAFITAETILRLHQNTGKVLTSWGTKQFLMPHGLTVDTEGNIWVTDVGLHQAIKFNPKGKQLMALGTRLEPGDDTSHFCKPTHVAVANDGTIFVADGYCNSRVMRFSKAGVYEAEYHLPRGKMDVPHSLVLDECSDSLYVADREHSEVHRFSISGQTLQGTWSLQQQGHVYSITAGPYGTVLALCWLNRQDPATEAVHVVLLSSDATGGGAEAVWRVEAGLGGPHDFALGAAPMPAHGTGDRALAVYFAETRPQFSLLRKFIFVPEGVTLEDLVEGGVEEEVVIPDPVAQGHGVEALLAAEQEKAVGGVGNAVPLTLADPHHSHAATAAAQDSPVGVSADGAGAMEAAKSASRSKLAELLRSMAGQKKQTADPAKADVDHVSLLTDAVVAADHTHDLDAKTVDPDKTSASFSHHEDSAQDQTDAFHDTFSQLLLFGMPFVVICAGAGVVYLKRSGRSLTGYSRPSHVQSPKV